MKKTMKYIIAILIAAIGVYNLINWFGQGSAHASVLCNRGFLPLRYFASS